MRDMTHLGDPQSAAGDSSLVPGRRTDQPRLAGMGALLGQMTFESINHSLFISARMLPVLFWPHQDERRLWRRIKPRMPILNQGRFHD